MKYNEKKKLIKGWLSQVIKLLADHLAFGSPKLVAFPLAINGTR